MWMVVVLLKSPCDFADRVYWNINRNLVIIALNAVEPPMSGVLTMSELVVVSGAAVAV